VKKKLGRVVKKTFRVIVEYRYIIVGLNRVGE
jgi:hypothetical protein